MNILFMSDIHGICDNLDYFENLIQNNSFTCNVLLGDYFVIESISIKKNVDRNRVLNFLIKYKD